MVKQIINPPLEIKYEPFVVHPPALEDLPTEAELDRVQAAMQAAIKRSLGNMICGVYGLPARMVDPQAVVIDGEVVARPHALLPTGDPA